MERIFAAIESDLGMAICALIMFAIFLASIR